MAATILPCLEQAIHAYDVELIGGDTTAGPLTITVQVMGAVPADRALTRGGAGVGDLVYVSGTPGDAAAAITVIEGNWPGHGQYKEYLLKRYYRPSARMELGQQLLDIATSAIDVSDGVAGDAALIKTLQEHVKAVTAPYKYPRQVAFADDLPKTVMKNAPDRLLQQRLFASHPQLGMKSVVIEAFPGEAAVAD